MDAILNYINERVGIIPFLIGIVLIIMALIMMRFPPKKINYIYGYRMPSAMKNQEVWDFSQKYAAIKMLQIGLVLFAVSFLNLLFDISQEVSLFLGISLMIFGFIYMVMFTERAIKKNFPNQ